MLRHAILLSLAAVLPACVELADDSALEPAPPDPGEGVPRVPRAEPGVDRAHATAPEVVAPIVERCGNALDDDDDGEADEGCVGNRAWDDRNRDGLQGAGEPGLAGVVVLLHAESGELVGRTTSDATGAYWFAEVPAGTYYLEAVPPLGYSPIRVDRGTDDALDSDFHDEDLTTPLFDLPAHDPLDHLDGGFARNVQS